MNDSLVETLNELLKLSEIGKIKYTPSYLKKASNDTLEKIHAEYKRQQFETINNELSNVLIGGFSELMGAAAYIDDVEGLKKELDNGLLKNDLKNISSYVTYFITYV